MSARIHPTAVIDPAAKIADSTEIGPYCVIQGAVEIGENCCLQAHVTVIGPTVIGCGNFFYSFAAIGQRSQDLKYSDEPTHLRIGDHNSFREFCTVHRATSPGGCTVLGNHGHYLAYCHIAHDCIVGDHVIISNNGTLAGHVVIADHAGLGGLTAVHQFCRVGRHAFTGGCSKIVQDIPPFMIADGNPATIPGINKTGLERKGFSAEVIKMIQASHRILYRGGLNTTQAVEKIETEFPGVPEIAELVDFIRTSPRGIIRRSVSKD